MLRSRSRRSRSSSSVRPTCLRSTWPPAASSRLRSRGEPCQNSARTSSRLDAEVDVLALLADCDDWQEIDAPTSNNATTIQTGNLCAIPPRETQFHLKHAEIVPLSMACEQVDGIPEGRGRRERLESRGKCGWTARGTPSVTDYCLVIEAPDCTGPPWIAGKRPVSAPLPGSAIHSQTRRPFPLRKE